MSEELFNAIKQGDASKVEQIIERNPNLANIKDAHGMSPVVVATYYGQSKIAQFLISNGARLDIFEASMTGRIETVKEVILEDKSAAIPSLETDLLRCI
jgi:ankyrin repeat protein